MQNEQVPSDASDDDDDDDDARRVGSGPSHPRLEVGRHGEQSRRDETRRECRGLLEPTSLPP
jgi:hypothetical protein